MKVLLLQNIPNLGKIDEIKEVAEGYARNFLFVKNLAVPATARVIEEAGKRAERKIKQAEKDLHKEQSLASRLDGFSLEIKEKAHKNGSLYAGVGPQKVAVELTKAGFSVNKTQILMKPIKEVGVYQAIVKFSHGLEVEIAVTVMAG